MTGFIFPPKMFCQTEVGRIAIKIPSSWITMVKTELLKEHLEGLWTWYAILHPRKLMHVTCWWIQEESKALNSFLQKKRTNLLSFVLSFGHVGISWLRFICVMLFEFILKSCLFLEWWGISMSIAHIAKGLAFLSREKEGEKGVCKFYWAKWPLAPLYRHRKERP